MSDNDMIRRGDALDSVYEADSLELAQHGGNRIADRIAALPAVMVGVYECAGCGRLCRAPEVDLATLRDKGAISCCPERRMEPLSAALKYAIEE